VSSVTATFSPVCRCPSANAVVALRVRAASGVKVWVVDGGGHTVRALADERVPAGRLVLQWDGRNDAGRVAPEGVYHLRVHLTHGNRTFRLPNPIRVDVTRPRVRILSAGPRVLSPDGDYRRERLIVRYRLSERARPVLLVNGLQRVRSRSERPHGHLEWRGRVNGRPLRPGRYGVTVVATDDAGNTSVPYSLVVRIRYVELDRRVYRVAPHGHVTVRVSTDVRKLRWHLDARHGVSRRHTLVLRAPGRGRYRLTVRARSHVARALVVVRAR
jgi:hypothetical protein